MESFTLIFNKLTAISTIGFVALSVFVAYLNINKKPLPNILKNKTLSIAVFSTIAMVGSLIYSNVIGFPPCDLCWYQRICMYPIALLSEYTYFTKKVFVQSYFKVLAWTGLAIALWHTFIYYTGINPLPCSATASCTARYVYEFGFVTIPLMSLSVFILLILILSNKAPTDSQGPLSQ